MVRASSCGLLLALHSTATFAFTTFDRGLNDTTREEQLMKNVTAQPENQGRQTDRIYIWAPILFVFFLTVVVLSALNFSRQKNKTVALSKEKNKQDALGNHYGTCKTNKQPGQLLFEFTEDRKNEVVATQFLNKASDGLIQPYIIHPALYLDNMK